MRKKQAWSCRYLSKPEGALAEFAVDVADGEISAQVRAAFKLISFSPSVAEEPASSEKSPDWLISDELPPPDLTMRRSYEASMSRSAKARAWMSTPFDVRRERTSQVSGASS
ncbi:MAG: hypothetical protein IPL62_11945 [Caulobacteraceae bacterium]|nr:hypothetical protein [Caulobacteraceae bacterium]